MENIRSQKNMMALSAPKSYQINHKLFTDWFSGLISGFTSVTICAPFDVARTRHMLQTTTQTKNSPHYEGFIDTMSKIYKAEGIRGLYKGYNVTAMAVPLFHSMYFSTFYSIKEYYNNSLFKNQNTILNNVLAAISSGFLCNTITNPFWVVRTRIQSSFLHRNEVNRVYKGIWQGMLKIQREEGVKALFKGLSASYIGLAHAAILYPLYELIKEKMTLYKQGQALNALEFFSASFVSKLVAMVITYPHVVIRTRMQDNKYSTKNEFMKLFRQTLNQEGLKGIYSGLRIDLIRSLPSNAITFMMFEFTKAQIEKRLSTSH